MTLGVDWAAVGVAVPSPIASVDATPAINAKSHCVLAFEDVLIMVRRRPRAAPSLNRHARCKLRTINQGAYGDNRFGFLSRAPDTGVKYWIWHDS